MAVNKDKNRDYSWLQQLGGFLSFFLGSRGDNSWRDSAVDAGAMPGGVDMLNWAYDEYSRRQQNQFTQDMYREDREWQEEMYERYQSIGGQIDQMRAAGINPAMMYANGSVNSPAVQSGQMPSSGAGSAVGAGRAVAPMKGVQTMQVVLSAISSMLGQGAGVAESISGIMRNKHMNAVSLAQADNYTADTQLKYQQADGQMLDNISKSIDLEFKRYNAQLDQMYKEETISKIRSEIANIEEDTLLKTKTIEVNGKQIDLMSQQIAESEQRAYLLQMQGMLTRIQKDQQERLGQLQQELLAARAMMTNAQSVVVKEQQTKAYAESQIAILEYIKQQKLMDGGYVDELLQEMMQGRKRRNADAIVGNICNVLNSIAGFIPTAGGSSFTPTSSTTTSY